MSGEQKPSEESQFERETDPQGSEEEAILEGSEAQAGAAESESPDPEEPEGVEPEVDIAGESAAGPAEPLPETPPYQQPTPTAPPPAYSAYPPSSQFPTQPYQGPAQPGFYAPSPPKDRNVAIVLEVLPGLFGFLGIGWLYAGNNTAGVLWLVLYLIWNIIAAVIDFATVSIFLCVHIPINIACLMISPLMLNNYIKKHPELFGV